MHQTFYRKYRPQVFDDVCGQNHITSILKFETANAKTSHAYLFCGSRGTGKTTCAKILAKAINCETPINGNPCCQCPSCKSIEQGTTVDVVEMDAASNNGVDYIRDIRDSIVYTPAEMKKRVYIIDEVHMLSSGAFNALLKTLEEPPEHAVFILATTELQKLPATIISRCQRFDFHRIPISVISDRLNFIAKEEGIGLSQRAAEQIARQAQGGMRDAISLFELCSSSGDVTEEKVMDLLGLSGYHKMSEIALSILNSEHQKLLEYISELYFSSKDILVFWNELQSFYRDMMVSKYVSDPKTYLDITSEDLDLLLGVAGKFTIAVLLYQMKILEEAQQTMISAPQNKRLIAEMALLRMTEPKLDVSLDSIIARLENLEAGVPTGTITQRETPAPAVKNVPPQKAEIEATPKLQPQTATQTPKPTSTDSVYTLVRDVSELLDIYGRNYPIALPFLSRAAIKTNADKTVVLIEIGTELEKKMIGTKLSEEALKKALALSGATTAQPEIRYSIKQGKDADPLSEFENLT